MKEPSFDDFQRVGDEINNAVRAVVAEKLRSLLADGTLSERSDDSGQMIVAAMSGMISAAGYLCASFEPSLDGDVMAGVVRDQFNAGREDFRLFASVPQ